MASKINYTDKVSIAPKPNPVEQLWRYVDANEVKSVVNDHAGDIDILGLDINYILGNIIVSAVSKTVDFPVVFGDKGKMFICDSASPIVITLNTELVGTIPVGSTVFAIRKGTGKVTVVTGDPSIEVFAQDNGTPDNYEIELRYGVISINHYASNKYIIAGNLVVV